MERFFGIIGILVMLLIAFLMSNNKKRINYKTVGVGLLLQFGLAVFVLKVPIGKAIFANIGFFIQKILEFAQEGSNFVFGPLTNNPTRMAELFGAKSNIFALQLIPALIFMMILVNILYYYGIMQRVIAVLGKAMNKLMDVSGAEALSNVASSFVGQIVAQIMIKPYLPNLTRSEVLASMTGSMACISGGVMAIYVAIGIPAQYLLAACIMAAPGALVISKIIYPETGEPQTKSEFKIRKRRTDVNVLDAIAKGASEGMKVGINVIAMIIALVALIAMVDWFLGKFGWSLHTYLHMNLSMVGIDLEHLSLKMILGKFFSIFAYVMGVPMNQANEVGSLLGTKFVLNETLAYFDLVSIKNLISEKSFVIATFALCGFANISSVAIQIAGIGELAPNQRKNLARVGIKALIGGTLASYISACMAGILL
ncbi:MAG: nucleoside transporter C-terminal domain-containing protein [Candidatus Gastranaerophilales bacterium]|nr:nucleoside transporter C-terminal domain-containing protein [Candidatus Gastranaerophilales bacterium]